MNTPSLYSKLRIARNVALTLGCLSFSLLLLPGAEAEPLTTDNYRLDPNVSDSFGGLVGSDSYELLDSGGAAVIGLGDSPSYKLSSGYIEQLEQSIELNVLPGGLVGYWPLDTGEGIQAYDTTADNNHGVLNNSPSWVDGQVGSKALDFPGSNSTYTDHGDTNDQTGSFTLSAWINPNDVSTSGQRIVIKDDGTDGWALSLGDGGTGSIRFYIRGASPVSTDTDNIISTDTWYHVVGVFDASENTKAIYVDGVREVQDTGVSGGPVNNASNLRFGRSFDGTIDEVKIYDKALSKDAVKDEYNAANAGASNALTLPRLEPGQDETVNADAIVRTDAGGYNIAIEQDGDLRASQGDTIPPIDGTIEFPNQWMSNTTGFGFTVLSAVQRDGKWGSDPDFEYAAVPDNTTTFHTRDGLSGAEKEIAELQFRAGVDATQAAGTYSNRIGFTATLKP